MRHGILAALLAAAPAFGADNPELAPFDEFQAEPRHVNLRLDPIAPLLDWNAFMKRWGFSIDVAVLQAVTVGPALRAGPSYKVGNSYAFARLLGLAGAYYMNGNSLTSSFVVLPSWYPASIQSRNVDAANPVSGELDAKEASLMAGYQWFFEKNFNLNAAAGLKYRYDVRNVTITNTPGSQLTSGLENQLEFASELMLGWAF